MQPSLLQSKYIIVLMLLILTTVTSCAIETYKYLHCLHFLWSRVTSSKSTSSTFYYPLYWCASENCTGFFCSWFTVFNKYMLVYIQILFDSSCSTFSLFQSCSSCSAFSLFQNCSFLRLINYHKYDRLKLISIKYLT